MNHAATTFPTASPSGGRRARKRAKVGAEIIAASLDLFAACGYAHTSIDAIADAVVLSRATIFKHFGHKEGIVLAWACDCHATLAASVDEQIAEGLPPEQSLSLLWYAMHTWQRAHREAVAVLVGEMFAAEPVRAQAARVAWPLHETVAAIVRAGQRAGALREDIAADRLGAFIARLLIAGFLDDAAVPEAFGNEDLAFILYGVSGPPTVGSGTTDDG